MFIAATLFLAGCICISADASLTRRDEMIRNFALLGILTFGAGFLVLFGFCLHSILRRGRSASAYYTTTKPTTPQSGQSRNIPHDPIDDKYRFVDKIPEYKVMLEQWMETEKPYLNQNFKLLDVMHALPLNRSYLSRMFNDAYGESFFSFVMRHRLQESVRLLESRPDLTAARIAQTCGFSSASVFGRAFLKNKGVTPKEYRKSMSSAV